MCICLWPEFDYPEVTLCGWQDIKIQLLLLFKSCLNIISSIIPIFIDVICWDDYAATGIFSILPGGPRAE